MPYKTFLLLCRCYKPFKGFKWFILVINDSLCASEYLPVGGTVDADLFRQLSGGKPSRKCGIMSSGNHLFFSEDGLRMLVTKDLDLSNAR